MNANPNAVLTSTSSSSPDELRNRAAALARLLRLLVVALGDAEMKCNELLRPFRAQQLAGAERETLLRMIQAVRVSRRFAETMEGTWKARLESFPKS